MCKLPIFDISYWLTTYNYHLSRRLFNFIYFCSFCIFLRVTESHLSCHCSESPGRRGDCVARGPQSALSDCCANFLQTAAAAAPVSRCRQIGTEGGWWWWGASTGIGAFVNYDISEWRNYKTQEIKWLNALLTQMKLLWKTEIWMNERSRSGVMWGQDYVCSVERRVVVTESD